jgi:hypothetical protein
MNVELAVVEGELERPVAAAILAATRHRVDESRIISKGGGGTLWSEIRRFDQVARNLGKPVLVLADLERESCPPSLLRKRLTFGKSKLLLVRLAVRMIESWLLADHEAFTSTFRVSMPARFRNPDELDNPKRALVSLVEGSPDRALRQAVCPQRPDALVGPDYLRVMTAFVSSKWSPARARSGSPSLDRALLALEAAHRS